MNKLRVRCWYSYAILAGGQHILIINIDNILAKYFCLVWEISSVASHTKYFGEQAVKNGFVSWGLQRMLLKIGLKKAYLKACFWIVWF